MQIKFVVTFNFIINPLDSCDWCHLNLRRHNFYFQLSNTVVTVALFVVIAAAVVASVVVPVVVVAVGKNVQASKTALNYFPYS